MAVRRTKCIAHTPRPQSEYHNAVRFGREIYVRGQRWLFDPDGRFVSPSDPQPDQPCWCWSGKRFDSCHMRRDQASKPTVADALIAWKSALPKSVCLAPHAPVGCVGKIVNSHVIQQEGGGLRNIAGDGKVYGFRRHPTFFMKQHGRHEPTLLGIKADVAIPLFCGKHDRELFKKAETDSFVPTAEQLIQLNYRTVACRLYTNEATAAQVTDLSDADRGLSRDDQRRIFIAIEAIRERSERHLANIRALKAQYDGWITADASRVNALVLRFGGAAEFMCASLVESNTDFSGTPIQCTDPFAHVCFYTIANDDSIAIVFSWVGENRAAEQLCSSLLSVSAELKASALLRFALEYIDLIYFEPTWWNGLTVGEREVVVERLTEHSKPFRKHATDALITRQVTASKLQYIKHDVVGAWRLA
jgi:hypothetical protein